MRVMRRRVLITGVILLAGCGRVMHRARPDINVSSTPQGANVEASPTAGTYTTPVVVQPRVGSVPVDPRAVVPFEPSMIAARLRHSIAR
jgi:hypothetical protein